MAKEVLCGVVTGGWQEGNATKIGHHGRATDLLRLDSLKLGIFEGGH